MLTSNNSITSEKLNVNSKPTHPKPHNCAAVEMGREKENIFLNI